MEQRYETGKSPSSGTTVPPVLDFAAERAEMLRSVQSWKLSQERYEAYDQKLREIEIRHSTDAASARGKFDSAKESLLRDTGEKLYREKAIADFQLAVYGALGIERRTYLNGSTNRFVKWCVDAILLDNAELAKTLIDGWLQGFVTMVRELLSLEALKEAFSHLWEGLVEFTTGDAYMRWKRFLSTLLLAVWAGTLAQASSKLVLSRLRQSTASKIASVESRAWLHPRLGSETHRPVPKGVPAEWNGKELRLHSRPGTVPGQWKKDLVRIFEAHPDATLDISRLSPAEKRSVMELVWKNHPMVEIVRILPNHTVTNVRIGWIKELNGYFWQEMTDRIVASFRSGIENRFDAASKRLSRENARLVRDNYKNITASIPESADPVSFLLWSASKEEAIASLVSDVRPLLRDFSRARWIPLEEAESFLRSKFDFWIWSVRSGDLRSDMDRMRAFYLAERHSRAGSAPGEIRSFDWQDVSASARDVMRLDTDIVVTYRNASFVSPSGTFPAVIRIEWKEFVNPRLLSETKRGVHIEPQWLRLAMKSYVDKLNGEFDFIAPWIDFEKDIASARSMNELLSRGKLTREMVSETFKGTLSKEAFYAATEGKQWVRVFVDVKDMGIANLKSFRNTAAEIVRTGDADLALQSGMNVTRRLMRTIDAVRKEFPEVKVSQWWDEILLFLEHSTKEQESHLAHAIRDALAENRFHGRMVHSYDRTLPSSEVFGALDVQTNVSKFFEKQLEKGLSGVQASPLPHLVRVHGNVPSISVLESLPKNSLFAQTMNRVREFAYLSNQPAHETLRLPFSPPNPQKLNVSKHNGLLYIVFE